MNSVMRISYSLCKRVGIERINSNIRYSHSPTLHGPLLIRLPLSANALFPLLMRAEL